MLKERVITAVVMLAVFSLLLAFSSTTVFAYAVALIVAAAAWEWSRLSGVENENAQTVFAMLVGAIALIVMHTPLVDEGIKWVMLAGVLFWLSVPVQFYIAPVLPPMSSANVSKTNVGWLALGVLVLPIAALSIQYLRTYAPSSSSWLLLYALGVVWVMDIGAYFTGRQFGRKKLAPLISPGKSWEGVYGGLAASAVLFLIVLLSFNWPQGTALKLLVATLFAAAFSVIGDLFESRLKRAAGMKDSSQLLPGHGGVLDRIDGVIAALPLFAFFWAWM